MKNWIIIVAVFVMAGCGASDKNAELAKLKKQKEQIETKIKDLESGITPDTTSDGGKVMNVAVKEVGETVFDHFIEIQGRLDGDENVGVTSQMLGVVKHVFVKPGESVRRGQVLGELDGSVMDQTLKELQASLEFVTDVYNRQKTLWEQKVGSELQYLQAKNNKESLENRIKTLKEQVEMTKIVSPINGNVEDVAIKVGMAVAPGFNAFRVVNFDRVKVVADVSETYSDRIKRGNKVVLYFPDLKHEVNSTVDFASKFINAINRTFIIEVRFTPEKVIEYKANMVVVTRINDYHNDKAIVVPINYIRSEEKGDFIMIAENGVAKKLVVKTGLSYNGNIEITEGLKTGDNIITAGYQDLEDGQKLKITN